MTCGLGTTTAELTIRRPDGIIVSEAIEFDDSWGNPHGPEIIENALSGLIQHVVSKAFPCQVSLSPVETVIMEIVNKTKQQEMKQCDKDVCSAF